jgi:hypothetical protein
LVSKAVEVIPVCFEEFLLVLVEVLTGQFLELFDLDVTITIQIQGFEGGK